MSIARHTSTIVAAVVATPASMPGAANAAPAGSYGLRAFPIDLTPTVTVARSVDLAAQPLNKPEPVAPGAVVRHRVAVKNNGPMAPTRGVALRINAEDAFGFAARYSNCQYAAGTLPDAVNKAWCTFDQPIAPGATYELSDPFYKLGDTVVPGHQFRYYYTWAMLDNARQYGDGWYEGAKHVPGTGAVLHLMPVKGQAPGSGDDHRATVVEADMKHPNDLAFSLVKAPEAAPSPGSRAGGRLPITGSDTTLAGDAGAGLLAIGVGAFLVARRWRTRFSA